MTKKNLNTNKVLNKLGFSLEEQKVFNECIKIAKEAQSNETINVELEFEKLIEGMINNEIQ